MHHAAAAGRPIGPDRSESTMQIMLASAKSRQAGHLFWQTLGSSFRSLGDLAARRPRSGVTWTVGPSIHDKLTVVYQLQLLEVRDWSHMECNTYLTGASLLHPLPLHRAFIDGLAIALGGGGQMYSATIINSCNCLP